MRRCLPALLLALAVSHGTGAARAQARDGGSVTLTGELRDEEGQPLPYYSVQACTTTMCLFGETGADGGFRFDLSARPMRYVIKTLPDTSAVPRRAAALAPVRIGDRSPMTVGAVYVSNLPPGVPLRSRPGPQTLQAGDGLALTLTATDLVAPPGTTVADVAARRLPSNRLAAYTLPGDERVIAVFAIHPFATTSRTPIAVRAASTLPAGTTVRFRTIDDIDGRFSEPVRGRATGTEVVTDPSVGIRALTHLVITAVSN